MNSEIKGFLQYIGLDKLIELIHSNFVMKEKGKTLSANDLTDSLKNDYDAAYEHSLSDHAPPNAEENVIDTIKVNGSELSVTEKSVNVIVPTDLGQLSNNNNKYATTDAMEKAIQQATGGDIGSIGIEDLEYYYDNGTEKEIAENEIS